MLRNPHTDMIVLEKPPKGVHQKQIEKIQKELKWELQSLAKDLCVRYYVVGPDQEKIIVYMGGCNKMDAVYNYLQSNKFRLGKCVVKFVGVEEEYTAALDTSKLLC